MNETKSYVCPVCGETIGNLHDFAYHLNRHSEEEKRKIAEEEKRRKADQKKIDIAKLEKLRKVYEDAAEAYIAAKEKFESDYDEKWFELDDLFSAMFNNFKNRWR